MTFVQYNQNNSKIKQSIGHILPWDQVGSMMKH